MSRLALKLKEKNPEKLVAFAQDILNKMQDNAQIFAAPIVPFNDLQTTIDSLHLAQQETLTGGTAATVYRNQRRKELEEMLRKIGGYVIGVAGSNPEIITRAGIPLGRRGPLRYDFITAPVKLRGEGAGPGMVSLRWSPVSNAKSYELEYCMDPISDNGWRKTPLVSASNAMVNGLTRKEEYWFRVRACGSKGLISEWSSPWKALVY